MKFPVRAIFILLLSFSLFHAQGQYRHVMAAEYFWDADPGTGNGHAMLATSGSFNRDIAGITQNIATLPSLGFHKLSIRAQDSTGTWGVTFTTVVQVLDSSTTLRADKIIAGEYFWDTDPGAGSANVMIAFDGAFNQAFEAISQSSALPSIGNHTLNVRAKDAAGNWGPVFTNVVQVLGASTTLRADKIIAGEYFWDTDPGQGSASPMIAFDGSFDQAFEAISQSSSLPSIGNHTLNVRAKDVAGNWGPVFTSVVQVLGASTTLRADKIIAGEYFWDTDPGQGSASPMIAFDGSFDEAFEAISQGASLPSIGNHTLNVRAKDVAGNWGPVFTTVVQVLGSSTTLRADKIIAGEYFWDTDPGAGNGSPMIAFDGSFDEAFEAISQSNVSLPSVGMHVLNIRTKDVAGNWGSVFSVVIQIGPSSTTASAHGVVAAEYFFDADPGQGNGTPMNAPGGIFGGDFQSLLGGAIPAPVTAGYHLLSMRSKDVYNHWGSLFSIVVNIDTTIGAPNVHIAGYTSLCSDDLAGKGYSTPLVAGTGYTWTITGGTITSGAGTSSVTVTWNSTGPNKLLLTGCDSSSHLCSSDSLIPVIKQVATTTINHTICQGQSFDGYSTQGTYHDTYSGSNGCDSIRTLNLTVLPISRSTITQSICPGQSYLGHNQTGTFNDTLTGSNSCDSIRTLILTVLNNSTTTITKSICQGQSYLGHNQSGTYTDTLRAANGCDSIHTLNLMVLSVSHTTVSQSICQGLSYGGHSTAGTFIDTLSGANGCDSIRTLNLTILPVSSSTITKSICAGNSYLGHSQTGTYVDTLQGSNSCDSIRTLNLTVLSVSRTTITQSICLGQSYAGHSVSGTFVDTFTASNTCDSIRTLNLTVTNGIRITINQTICPGHSFDGHSQGGTYIDTFTAVGGCDSIRTLSLTVLSNVTSNISISICQGQSYGGHNSGGTFVDTLLAANGCDSIRTLLLTILPVSQTTVNRTICHGQSYAGHNASGNYIDTLAGSNTCDSIRTLNLIVLPAITTTINQSICQGQNFAGHSGSGIYIDTLQSSAGCDSIVTLNLTVSAAITTTLNKSICPGQSYAGHSTTGIYIDTLLTAAGCDSIVTLNLTVSGTVTTSVNKNICQGQTYGGHSATGTYVDSFTAAGGCDSIRTLNLVVLSTLTTSDVQSVCQGHSFGGHNATGTYVDTFSSSYGCDSIRTLHLTVIAAARDTLSHSICQGDTFKGHTASGFYTDSFTTVMGCDSFVTLHLSVIPLPPVPSLIVNGLTIIASDIAGLHYQWYRDSIITAGDTNQVLTLTLNGNYTVIASDSFGCSRISSVTHITDAGINDINGIQDILIYPNPASGVLNVKFTGLAPGTGIAIKLSDAIGQNLLEKTIITSGSGSYTAQLSLQALASGVYLLQVQYNKQTLTKRVVVAK